MALRPLKDDILAMLQAQRRVTNADLLKIDAQIRTLEIRRSRLMQKILELDDEIDTQNQIP